MIPMKEVTFMEMKKIGIMGGTFNPIHNGHLVIAESAREQFGLQKVWFLPSGRPPHKRETMSASRRCEMVSLAIADNPFFILDRRETESPEISYTYATLEAYKKEDPSTDLYFILGADSLFDFESWRKPEAILQHCSILAAFRRHGRQEEFFQQIDALNQKYPGKFFPLDTPSLEVSSQDIRSRVRHGRSIRYLVPREVGAYIQAHHLYEGGALGDEPSGN